MKFLRLTLICFPDLGMWAAADEAPSFGLTSPGPVSGSGNKVGAVIIFVGLGWVRLWWLLSWAYGVLLSNQWMRMYVPAPARAVMQTSHRFIIDWSRTQQTWRGRRPRYCRNRYNYSFASGACVRGNEELGDRVYHCSRKAAQVEEGRRHTPVHLPLYDHYCYWIRIVVYLDSMKPYLFAITFMSIDAILVFALSIFAIARREQSRSILHVPMSVIAAFVIAYLSGDSVVKKWWLFALRNRIAPEEDMMGSHLFAIAVGTSERPDFIFSAYEGNPWDLGPWENLKEVLGDGWSWLLFWVRPRRVKNYRKNGYLANHSDFKMSDDFLAWVSNKRLESSRSREASEAARALERRRGLARSDKAADRRDLGGLTFRRNQSRLGSRSEGGVPTQPFER